MNLFPREILPIRLQEWLTRKRASHGALIAIIAPSLLLCNFGHPVLHVKNIAGMKEIGISEFRIKCCAILEQVRRTRRPIRVTRYGRPLAEIVPPFEPKRRLGCMIGTGEILGDIVGPTGSFDDWEAWRD